MTDEDGIRVMVGAVYPHGSVWLGEGYDEATGDAIEFAGDHRAMADIGAAIAETGDMVRATVPSWAVRSRRPLVRMAAPQHHELFG